MTDFPTCEPEKPICFNYKKDENKNILYNCDGSDYNIFEALEAAYAIKNNENDNKYDNYKTKQCMNKAIKDFNDQNTCTCTNFDSVWMTAIKQAEREYKIIQNELAKPETAVIIKENIDKPPTETEIIKKKNELEKIITDNSHGKSSTTLICDFFRIIAESMKKNIDKNNDNKQFITLFCNSVEKAIVPKLDIDLDNDEAVKVHLELEDKLDPLLQQAAVNIFKGLYLLTHEAAEEAEEAEEADATAVEAVEAEEAEEAAEAEEAEEAEATAVEADATAVEADATAVRELFNKIIEIVAKLFNIGNYVLEDSRHFDKAAFISTGELFKECYENPISSTSSVLPGGQKGGRCKGGLATLGWLGIACMIIAFIAVGVATMGIGGIVGLIVLITYAGFETAECGVEYNSKKETDARKLKKKNKELKKEEEKEKEKENQKKLEQRIKQYKVDDIVYHRTDNYEEYYGEILNVNSKKKQVNIKILYKSVGHRGLYEKPTNENAEFKFDIGISDKLYKKRNEVPLRIRGTDLIIKKQSDNNINTDMFIIQETSLTEPIQAKSIDGDIISNEIINGNQNFSKDYDAYKETVFDDIIQKASGGRKTHSQNKRHTRTKKRKITKKKRKTNKKITKKRKANKRRKTTKK